MKKLIFLLTGIVLTSFYTAQADLALVDLIKKVKPCVVLIGTLDKDNRPLGQGSGFFIDNKGGLITNYHVIEGAYSAVIKTSAGKEYPVQGVIAKDIEADIVKLIVDIDDANIPFLKLSLNVPSEGEDVVVIGNPLGLESTISTGIVSAVRDIPAFGKIFQITAPISQGSSGSPVLNKEGEVIGVATLVVTKGQNLNFAMPSGKIVALKETAKTPLSEKQPLLTADANDATELFNNGLIELWQENCSAALEYFQKATEKNPQDEGLWFCIGATYGQLGRFQEAIDACKQAIRINPDLAEAHYNLGVYYGDLGRFQEAIDAYKQAIRITPDYAEAHYNLGVTYGALGRFQEAIDAYKQAIRINPDYAESHCNLGATYAELGRFLEAIDAYKQAIRINPDLALAHGNLGVAYVNLSRFQEAIDAYKQAIKIKPDDADTHCILGVAYINLSRFQEAIDAYKQAIRINPDLALAHYLLGVTYFITGDKGSAFEEYKILKNLDEELANELFNLIYK